MARKKGLKEGNNPPRSREWCGGRGWQKIGCRNPGNAEYDLAAAAEQHVCAWVGAETA